MIKMVDEFIVYDDAQFTKRDWRNRNKIKTAQGATWLSIPVKTKGKFLQAIKDTEAEGIGWRQKHWRAIELNYAQAPWFKDYAPPFLTAYSETETNLSKINLTFIDLVCRILGIGTKISASAEYKIAGNSTEKLVSICRQAGATHYLSGPAAQSYIEPAQFEKAGIELEYMDYTGYPEYPQLYPPFQHQVSVIDLIFNVGEEAPRFMKGLQ